MGALPVPMIVLVASLPDMRVPLQTCQERCPDTDAACGIVFHLKQARHPVMP